MDKDKNTRESKVKLIACISLSIWIANHFDGIKMNDDLFLLQILANYCSSPFTRVFVCHETFYHSILGNVRNAPNDGHSLCLCVCVCLFVCIYVYLCGGFYFTKQYTTQYQ